MGILSSKNNFPRLMDKKGELENYNVLSPIAKNNWVDNIDLFIYINLDHRTDRKKNMQHQLKTLGIPNDKVLRLSADHNDQGFTGCTHSHLKAVQMAIKFGYNNVCIMEDDFTINVDPVKFHDKVSDLFGRVHRNFDVIYLSMTPIKLQNIGLSGAYRVQKALAMPGFIVSRKFLSTLKKIYKEALQKNTPHDLITQYYQPVSKWYGFYPPIAVQAPGFSDIEQRYVDYKNFEVDGQMLTFI